MAFFKSTRNSPGPLVTVNTTTTTDSIGQNFSDNSLNRNSSPNPLLSNSLESLQNQWEIDPELPRNMYMPCVGTSAINNERDFSNVYNNRIYILGSHNNNQCWVYDATYKTYEKLPYFPKKIVPKGHCVTTCDNIIFSTGGSTQSKHLLFFNTVSHEWHTAPNSRAKDFGIGSKCIAIKNNEMNKSMDLHVIGGNRKPNKYYIYNRAVKQWREGPKLPLKLTYHGMIYVGENNHRSKRNNKKVIKAYLRHHKPQIIVFGGCNVKKAWSSNLSPSTKMYRLYLHDGSNSSNIIDNHDNKEEKEENPIAHNNKWRHIGDLPVAVQNFAYLCVLNNYILIFGGDLGDLQCSRNIYMYNIASKTWKLLGIKLPDHLYGMTACETQNGVIHIFGGHNGKSPQRLHLSIRTSTLLRKEFDEFDSQSFTWKSLSRLGVGDDINDDVSLLDELKRVKRKLKDLEEKYNETQLQYKQLYEENTEIKHTNLSLLDKLAEAMQEKEEISYEVIDLNKQIKHSKHSSKSRSKSPDKKSHKKPKAPRHKHKKYKNYNNPYIENELMINYELKLQQIQMQSQQNGINNNNNENRNRNRNEKINFDPKYIMFRNFLFGRIGLSQYLNEFKTAKYSNICKMIDLNDQILKLKIGISNELHRKLILRIINEFKLEILQFKSWISSYDNEPNLVQYIKPLAKHGIITWHLLAQHIENKKDFTNKLGIENMDAIHCLYTHLCEFLNGSIPQPNKKKKKSKNNNHENKNQNQSMEHSNSNIISMNYNDSIENNNALFDDSGYHNW